MNAFDFLMNDIFNNKDFLETYDTYKGRYFDETDIEEFGSRTDTYALKEHLKQIGFDYDK